tara:strand:- start:708 stop:2339 length:1632 start_codon:yes stop_codon:yes gene_type:complete
MFKKGQVLYVIKDGNEKNYERVNNILSSFNISISDIQSPNLSIENFPNERIISEYIDNLPSNTVFGRNIFESGGIFIAIPMLSSHISIPIKPGEYFWYFEDNQDGLDVLLENNIRIKNFWFSRMHGTNISEDSNFSFYQRDFQKYGHIDNEILETSKTSREKQESKLEKEILFDTIKELTYEDNDYFKDLSNDIRSTTIIDSNENNFKAYNRFFSDNRDLTLQGSNNTIINLGRNLQSDLNTTGAIDIVAGRNYIDDLNYNIALETQSFDDNFELKGQVLLNYKEEDSSIKDTIKTVNLSGYQEILKDPEFYFKNNDEFKTVLSEDLNESRINIDLDASRIYVSEDEIIDTRSFYDNNFLNDQLTLENSGSLPTIFLKSNNIRLVSRKRIDIDEENFIEEGSIRLIKESNNYDNYSHFLMESDGKILIDGKNILIGSASKNKEKEEDKHIVSICETENSEPVVLGKKLEEKLNKIIDLNIKTLEALSDLTTSLFSHSHGPPGSPAVNSPEFLDTNIKSNSIKQDFNNIKQELKEFLSIYVKTS